MGARVIEKHLALSRDDKSSVDSAFSSTPEEFTEMVAKVRLTEDALGSKKIGPSKQEEGEFRSRRSIFVSKDIQKGELFTNENLKIVRPADGLKPRYWENVLGKKAKQDLSFGTALQRENIEAFEEISSI